MAVTEDQARTAINEVFSACSARNPRAGYGAAITEGARLIRAELGGRHWKRVSAREALQAATAARARVAAQRPAVSPDVVRAAVAEAERLVAARRKAGKAARRATREAADQALVSRMVAERLQAAHRLSEAVSGPALREASNEDLRCVAVAAMSGAPAPAARPVVEMTVDPAVLSLEDLAVAAAVGSAGSSPFWTGQTSGQSPFMRGLQAADGTAGG